MNKPKRGLSGQALLLCCMGLLIGGLIVSGNGGQPTPRLPGGTAAVEPGVARHKPTATSGQSTTGLRATPTTPRATPPGIPARDDRSRGYLTTPDELRARARLARSGIEPYQSAVDAELKFAARALEDKLPSAPKKIKIKNDDIDKPIYLRSGSRYAYAWAIAYNLLRDTEPVQAQQYADRAREVIMEMPRLSTQISGYEENTRLNISVSLQTFVYAADLLADWPLPESGVPFGRSADAQKLRAWLGAEIIRYPYNVAHTRVNNWGAWGRLTTAVIADYVGDAAPLYVQRLVKDTRGAYQVDPQRACEAGDVKTCVRVQAGSTFADAIRLHYDVVDGRLYEFSESSCDTEGFKSMIRPDGGIPDELRRQYRCDAQSVRDADGPAARYSQFALEAMVCLAEVAWRRGDPTLYTHIDVDSGRGAIFRGLVFLIINDVTITRGSMIEMAHYFYTHQVAIERDTTRKTAFQQLLRLDLPGILKRGEEWPVGAGVVSFGTLTHGFSEDRSPRPPPMVPARIDDS